VQSPAGASQAPPAIGNGQAPGTEIGAATAGFTGLGAALAATGFFAAALLAGLRAGAFRRACGDLRTGFFDFFTFFAATLRRRAGLRAAAFFRVTVFFFAGLDFFAMVVLL
jgi:hypothetical protein